VSQSDREFVCEVGGAGGQQIAARVVSPVPIAEVLVDGVAQPCRGREADLSIVLPAASEPLRGKDDSGAGWPRQNLVKIRLWEGATEGRFALICEQTSRPLPLGKFTVNGSEVKPRVLQGDRWRSLVLPLTAPENEVAWSVPLTTRPTVPFGATSFVMSACASARRPLAAMRVTIRLAESVGALAALLPTPFAIQTADFSWIQAPREVSVTPPDGFAPITAAQLKTIRAARLHVAVFGVNAEEKYARKPITLNGSEIGILPTNNRYHVDEWEEKTIEIPPDQWDRIAAHNVVTVTGCGGDCFKITDVALAVQLADGTWAESDRDLGIYCGVGPGWLYFEGISFRGNRSPEIQLELPVE